MKLSQRLDSAAGAWRCLSCTTRNSPSRCFTTTLHGRPVHPRRSRGSDSSIQGATLGAYSILIPPMAGIQRYFSYVTTYTLFFLHGLLSPTFSLIFIPGV